MADKMCAKENAADQDAPPAYNGVVTNGGMAPYSVNGGVVANVPLPQGSVMTMANMGQQGPSLTRTVTGYDGERWMAPLEQSMTPLNCPPGLEYLTMIDQLMVRQRVEVLEALCGCETNNKYKVLNILGQVMCVIISKLSILFLECVQSQGRE